METLQVHCPKCGSSQITANKKGFSGKKAVVGALLTGGIGIAAGTIGSGKIIITCLNCGNQFKPGEGKQPATPKPQLSAEKIASLLKEQQEKIKQAEQKAEQRRIDKENTPAVSPAMKIVVWGLLAVLVIIIIKSLQ